MCFVFDEPTSATHGVGCYVELHLNEASIRSWDREDVAGNWNTAGHSVDYGRDHSGSDPYESAGAKP